MRFIPLALLAVFALAAPAAVSAQKSDIVVNGGVQRAEIERILAADNVDTSKLSEREVANAIRRVKRGRAPKDFWLAYRAHVLAWERLADIVESAGQGKSRLTAEDVAKAEQAIDATFGEVERIARSYGARLPTPPWSIPPTV